MSNCFHCQQVVTKTNQIVKNINKKEEVFCCVGCISVCEMIYQSGLTSFYQYQSSPTLPKVELEHRPEIYDSEAFQKVFLERQTSQQKSIILTSPTIHCPACIWLIEKSLFKLKGVIAVSVNLAEKRIQITWKNPLALSKIMQTLANLGYSAAPFESNIQEEMAKKQHRAILYRIIFASFTMMNLLWVSISLYSGATEGKFLDFFNILSFALATPTVFYAGFLFFKNAFLGLRHRHINMDLPITIGILTTYFYSTYLLFFTPLSALYFDTVVNFIFVLLIGRFFETQAKKQAISSGQTLQQLQPKVITTLLKGKEIIKPILLVEVGDIVLVRPGEKIGVDGEIIAGQTKVNESLLTGEVKLLSKKVTDFVFSGTLNDTGSIQIKVIKSFKQSRLNQIINLIAQTSPSKQECTIDKFIPYFVITTLSLAVISFLVWWQIDINLAILSSVSVLIITCPCAFGIATPISMAVASNMAAKHNILIKNNLILEQFHKATHLVFDKTGTLTTGKMTVKKVINFWEPEKKQEFFNIVASLESHSEHPIAKSIIKNPYQSLAISDFKAIPGKGIEGFFAGKKYFLGSFDYIQQKTKNASVVKAKLQNPLNEGDITIWCADEWQVLGLVSLNDELKKETLSTITTLQKMGKKITVLTGDTQKSSQSMLKDFKNITLITQQSPEQKATVIKQLQQQALVVMIGDGFNDTVALAQANMGIVIGSGADIAHQNAHCVLLSDNLNALLELNTLSQKTQKTIKQNIIFALTYNAITVPLAMMALVTPLFAAILMPISSLVVIINASFLRKK